MLGCYSQLSTLLLPITGDMKHFDPAPLDCPECRTELISDACGKNRMCPRCTFRIITWPCECPDGYADWPFPLKPFGDFLERLLG